MDDKLANLLGSGVCQPEERGPVSVNKIDSNI